MSKKKIILLILMFMQPLYTYCRDVFKDYNVRINTNFSIADVINNSTKKIFDFENKIVEIDQIIKIERSNITIKNLQIKVKANQKLYNVIIQDGQGNNRFSNIKIDGNYSCCNGLSVYNSKNVTIEHCIIENIGYNNVDVVSSAIRFIGNCSKSRINNCIINNVYSNNNSTGITVTQTFSAIDVKRKCSKNITIKNCQISNITSSQKKDADGIKVLEELIEGIYNKGYHKFKNLVFVNCEKRGLKLQTTKVKCINITCKDGDFSQGAIDFFGANNYISGLYMFNLNLNKHTYGIYLHNFDRAYINNIIDSSFVIANSNNTLIYSECNNEKAKLYIDNVDCEGHNMLYRCKFNTFIKTIDIANTKIKAQYNYSIMANCRILLLHNFEENIENFSGWYRTFEFLIDSLQIVKSNKVITIDKVLFDKIALNKKTNIIFHSFDNKKSMFSLKNRKVSTF